MQITELVWKLFLLLIPGVVATIMLIQITGDKKMSVFNFVINSALYGIASFLIMEFSISLFNIIKTLFYPGHVIKWGLNLTIWNNLFDNNKEFNKIELVISYILSIPLGIFYGYFISRKLLNRLFKPLKLTNRYGDNDVWSFFLNSPNTQWVLVRDKLTNLTYFGNVRAYSDTSEKREILLNDVQVLQQTNGNTYMIPILYF
jgi:hypothetical protein